MRPFNFYVFPSSTIMDSKNIQFQTSNINFLMSNNFDFNKLFKSGISYQRISDKDIIKQRVSRQLFELPQFTRSHTHLGTKSTQTLESYVKKVQNFVELAKKDANQTKVLELDIESFALKKQLARELYDIYRGQRIIFTEYKKGSRIFTVKKWKSFDNNFDAGKSLIESKFASPAKVVGMESANPETINQEKNQEESTKESSTKDGLS